MSASASKANRPKARQSIAHFPASNASSSDKENATTDITGLEKSRTLVSKSEKKKSRSKSLGPGGLEALKESSGNSSKPSPPVHLKSILKPAVPLTPPKAIPAFEASRRSSTGKRKQKSPTKSEEELLIDFSTPAANSSAAIVAGSENLSNPFSPLPVAQTPTKGATQSQEDDDRADELERNEEERRKSAKQAILDQRAARRKSMANRRVSFAPEATLHTWNVVELPEDSTTSSSSNSTRRQSSMSAAQTPTSTSHATTPDSDPSEPPSTPPEQVEEPQVVASPAHQRDLHQKKRRRKSSTVAAMDSNNQEDNEAFSSSPFSGSSTADVESSPALVEDSMGSDDSDEDGDTAMSIEDATGQTAVSTDSGSSTRSSLDERLRQAAQEAGTQGIEHDENVDDVSMDIATDSVTHAFQPFANKSEKGKLQDLTSMQDQENVNPFSPAFKREMQIKHERPQQTEEETQDMSMDMTMAVGSIIPAQHKPHSPKNGRRRSGILSNRRRSVARGRESDAASLIGDETMDFTTAAGGIVSQQMSPGKGDDSMVGEDEDMSMEFTNMVSGFANPSQPSKTEASVSAAKMARRTSTDSSTMGDETMDMTAAIGAILPPIEERTEPNTEVGDTQPMDITRAVGGILEHQRQEPDKTRAKQLMEAETDVGQLNSSPFLEEIDSVQPKAVTPIPEHVSTIASETGSPSMALKPRLSGRKVGGNRHSTTPKSTLSKPATPIKAPSQQTTPIKASAKKVSTPTKQLTPLPTRPETPNKTPVMSNVTHRGASPKKLFKAEIKARNSPASAQKSAQRKGLLAQVFSKDSHTGEHTPSVVLAPKPHQHLRRRSSGIGVDQEGLGSPRVSDILDRRASIGESVPAFVSKPDGLRTLRFEDPKQMEHELDVEREEEERRESGRFIMEQEADMAQDENATQSLKDMIESMTPKKNKLKGRKSLHVGAAKGLLGKRPAELDMEDEDDAENTPKRLKKVDRPASPVKNVHLPAPPSKAETTGRVTRAKRRSLEEVSGDARTPTHREQSPEKSSAAHTPKVQGRFKDAPPPAPGSTRPTSFEDKLDNAVIGALDAEIGQALSEKHTEQPDAAQERIHLQDFLNMTGIHFMELNTTKRRHTTLAPLPSTGPEPPHPNATNVPASLADSVVAATTTLPLLELYQHATRELKSYISSGRRIIRSIEAETLEEQPPLFREYVDARPDVKMVMDNQFRNGKVNARLRSKEGWYAWRSQLVDGLRGGLEAIKEDLQGDATAVGDWERVVEERLPPLEERRKALRGEEEALQRRLEELEGEDRDALAEARRSLHDSSGKLDEKRALLDELKAEMAEKEETLSAAAELKQEFLDQIAEAERVREECRGWNSKDVTALRKRVEEVERKTGWKIVAAEDDGGDEEDENGDGNGPALTMRYRGELRLFFYPTAFEMASEEEQDNTAGRSMRNSSKATPSTAPISLTYAPADGGNTNSSKVDSTITNTTTISTECRFVLQLLQSYVQATASLPRGSMSAGALLQTIAKGWDLAGGLAEEVRILGCAGMVEVGILGDEVLGVQCICMLGSKLAEKGRVDINYKVRVGEGLGIEIWVEVRGVYGERVVEALKGKKGETVRERVEKLVRERKGEMGSGVLAEGCRLLVKMMGETPGEKKAEGRQRTPRRR
ncbi:MAG: hypothetical protein Q9227_004874 [Pyrenula ochraceoflavens]